jgi:hypothetical protein
MRPTTTSTVHEILPGVHHWTAFHEGIREPVSSYYVEPAGALVDPLVPDDGLEWFAGHVKPQQVLLTSFDHWRHSDRFVKAFGCLVRLSHRGLMRLPRGWRAEPFNDADEVAPGVVAVEIDKLTPDETVFTVAAGPGALAFGRALMRPAGAALSLPPADERGTHPDRVAHGLRDAFRGLLTRDFDALLFAHGEPLVHGGKTALREFLERPVGEPWYGDTA